MKINNETKVGLMIFVVFVLLGLLTYKTGDFEFAKNLYPMRVHFQNIDGVSLNSPVMYNGYEVGTVDDIEIINGAYGISIQLTLKIDNKARLRKGAKAYVKLFDFMGGKYVGLTAGDKDADFLPANSIIIGQEPADIAKLIQDGQEIAAQIKSITYNVNERLTANKKNVDEILISVNKASISMVSIVQNLDERLRVNEGKIDDILTDFNETSGNLQEMTDDLKLHPWKILHKNSK